MAAKRAAAAANGDHAQGRLWAVHGAGNVPVKVDAARHLTAEMSPFRRMLRVARTAALQVVRFSDDRGNLFDVDARTIDDWKRRRFNRECRIQVGSA